VAAGGIALPAVLLSAPAVTPGIAPPAAHSSAKTTPANSKLVPATSAEQAAREAQRANGGGRVLAVDLTPQGYRVKIIKHGEVRLVVVPAAGH
jgi:hypothetical protein